MGFLGLVFEHVKLSRKADSLKDETVRSGSDIESNSFVSPLLTPEQFSPEGGRGGRDV